MPVERTAMLMEALLGAPVSAKFVAPRAPARLAERWRLLTSSPSAFKDALNAQDVLCGDETPINIAFKDLDERGGPVPGRRARHRPSAPPRAAGPAGGGSLRSSEAIRAVKSWTTGAASWSATTTRAGPSSTPNCRSRAVRRPHHPPLRGASGTCTPSGRPGPGRSSRSCAGRNRRSRTPRPTVAPIRTPTCSQTCTTATTKPTRGIVTNSTPGDWKDDKNHPGHVLAPLIAGQSRPDLVLDHQLRRALTNNASERALKNPKLHQKLSSRATGTPWPLPHATAGGPLLPSAPATGVRPIDAIHQAPTGTPGHHRQRPHSRLHPVNGLRSASGFSPYLPAASGWG